MLFLNMVCLTVALADRCIICKSQISPARMELHVQMHFAAEDRENRSKTLENESKRKSVAAPQPEKESKKPLPKLNYHIMQLKVYSTIRRTMNGL
jgi:hypothetical protein